MIKVKRPFDYYDTALGIIGRTGENDTRKIDFDCTAALTEYPDANIICVCLRPGDDEPYTIPLSTDGDHRILTLASADLEKEGRLTLELRMVDGDKVMKSARFTGTVTSSLQGEGDAPGMPVRDTLDRLDAEIKAAQAVVDDIRAKLDAGEFDGPQGPKGDPGSDASVTAEDIQSALGYAPVKDVQVAGSSVLVDGVANVPVASETKEGVIKAPLADGTSGIQLDNDNRPCVFAASEADITARQTIYRPLVPARMDYAVKAAMCDGKGATWTDAEQKAARERMGVDKEYELIEEITLTENVTQIIRTDEPDGTAYAFERVAIKINRTNTGEGGVYVYSGSTVLGWSYLSGSGQYFACETFSLHGYWQNYRYSASSGHNDYNSIAPSGDSRFLKIKKVAGQYVSKIQITLNNAELGIGTKISIYGVRA